MKTILTGTQLTEAINVLVSKINVAHPTLTDVVFVGIQQGGVVVGNDMIEALQQLHASETVQYGQLDITFYRDDIRNEILTPDTMNLPFAIEGKTVVLIDDVLFTGRTIKAALDVLLDYGRPASITLAVLINRGGAQLPIAPQIVGAEILLKPNESLQLSQDTKGKLHLSLETDSISATEKLKASHV